MQLDEMYTSQFKVFAVTGLLREPGAMFDLSGTYHIPETTLLQWDAQFVSRAATVFCDALPDGDADAQTAEDAYISRLAFLRKKNKVSQTMLAGLFGTAQNVYSRYELGKNQMPVKYVKMLALFYDVSADYLLGMEHFEADFSAQQKAELALQMITDERQAHELAQKAGTSEKALYVWRNHLLGRGCMIFENKMSKIREVNETPYLPRLRELRIQRKMTQKQTGEVIGIVQDSYAKYENGVVALPIRRFILLCQYFGVSADEMLGLA